MRRLDLFPWVQSFHITLQSRWGEWREVTGLGGSLRYFAIEEELEKIGREENPIGEQL